MLTRVEIHGFKSFQEFGMDLEPLLMVLGANSAGKSNLFDAFALLSRLAQMDVSQALKAGRGSIRDQFSRTSGGVADTMSFAVELLLSDTDPAAPLVQTRFRYEVTIGRKLLPSGVEELSVLAECLGPIARADDTWIAGHPELAGFARYDAKAAWLMVGAPDDFGASTLLKDTALPERLFRWSPTRVAVVHDWLGAKDRPAATTVRDVSKIVDRTVLAEMGAMAVPHLAAVARELRGWRFLHLGMAALREPSERGEGARLRFDGSNLPTALASLPAEVSARVQADLVELVPGLRSVQAVAKDDEFAVEATFTDGQHYPQRVLSDGTLRLIALLVTLHSAEPGTLVAYEEPENGLFPGRLRELLRRLRAMVQRPGTLPVQVVLNGHSPAILAGLYDAPGSLAFADLVRRKDGVRRTRVRRIDTREQSRDPATLVGRKEVEALLDAARPESGE